MARSSRTTTSPEEAPVELPRLRRGLRRWYRANGRHDLPWRLTRDPYAVLVSEVMLQQTQVERVRSRYEAWLARWPTAASLAEAPAAAVIREWSGLGYNRRAVNLQRAAREALERFGRIPLDEAKLRSLPGVGPYTAAAVACFAGGRRTAALDTNVARVVARALLGEGRAKAPYGVELREAAEAWLPARGARAHQLAVMDLGATVCKASSPACEVCPLARGCAWLAAGQPESRPAVPKGTAVPFESTARFARGRIVAMLAEGLRLTADEVAARLPEEHRAACEGYLEALARDGSVASREGRWGLAEDR
ncbi:MAG: A/G-specific adenine glycosylase [Dehalococcoidia bacterium]|nr:A/G-specific adenine glycosylase [Dehalococcoidia bacterium]